MNPTTLLAWVGGIAIAYFIFRLVSWLLLANNQHRNEHAEFRDRAKEITELRLRQFHTDARIDALEVANKLRP